jgi:hypothetical protein
VGEVLMAIASEIGLLLMVVGALLMLMGDW